MKVEKIDLDKTDFFSDSFLEYVAASEQLSPFYTATPTIDHFEQVIKNRNFPKKNREVLVDVLNTQYQGLATSPKVQSNIDALRNEKTFTITTGHQLNIFTGPLYFIYKIVTVINAAKELKHKYPQNEFIPVYWMASEDHDFEEISYFFLNGQKRTWKTEQSGAVGHFDPKELKSLLADLPEDIFLFEKAYLENDTLANAARQYVNDLFGEQGLVVIDADNAQLKAEFSEVITSDLTDQNPKELVDRQSDKLSSLGFKIQVNCRKCNFFYLHNGIRARIEKNGDGFHVVDTELKFSESELLALVESNPERFSPNVILRPLYQEHILPNLAYIGGPSELVYWLQLKLMFESFDIPFPILMPRNFGTFIPKYLMRTWDKTKLPIQNLFDPTHKLEKLWLAENGEKELLFEDESKAVGQEFDTLIEKANEVDTTLTQHLEALKTQTLSKIQKAEGKLIRAEKRNHEDTMRQIHNVKGFLFPNGSLQERRDNFLSFYQQNPAFIDQLLHAFDPFDYRMHVLTDE